MKPKSVIVIGAGIGGIAAAAHLARKGWHVTVLEKNHEPGGRCDRYTREGHTFDLGPTLYVMPLVYEQEFTNLGVSVHEMLDLQRVDPTYQLVFDDGSQLALCPDLPKMYRQMEALEPGSFRGLLRYLDEGSRHYHLAMQRLVTRDFRKASEFFTLKHIPLIWQLKPFVRHFGSMTKYFKSQRLKSAFTFQDVYMGLSPFEAPATFSMMPYTELAHGVYFPRGGMYRVVEALMEIARQAGVEFVYDVEVGRIDVSAHTREAGGVILTDGRRIEAEVVLANADLPYVYDQLLPDTDLARSMKRKHFSCSVISFFWGVNEPISQLGAHTLFLVDDYRQNFVDINRGRSVPDHPSIYVHAPTRLDPSLAPAGEDTIIGIVPCGHLDQNNADLWDDWKEPARQAIFRKLETLGVKNFTQKIKFELCYTPVSWNKHFNLMNGATHGLSHHLLQLGYMRPANRHPRYSNVYFVGASTHPGTGVPTALISARLVAQRIIDEGR